MLPDVSETPLHTTAFTGDELWYYGPSLWYARYVSDQDTGWNRGTMFHLSSFEVYMYKHCAEGERFELSVPVRVQRFSRPSRSTTLVPLRSTLQAYYGMNVPKYSTKINRMSAERE